MRPVRFRRRRAAAPADDGPPCGRAADCGPLPFATPGRDIPHRPFDAGRPGPNLRKHDKLRIAILRKHAPGKALRARGRRMHGRERDPITPKRNSTDKYALFRALPELRSPPEHAAPHPEPLTRSRLRRKGRTSAGHSPSSRRRPHRTTPLSARRPSPRQTARGPARSARRGAVRA